MPVTIRVAWVLAAVAIGCSSEPLGGPRRDGGPGGGPDSRVPLDLTDDDRDTIADVQEGAGMIDTDGDGTPDAGDEDSDGDGYTDAEEAGDDDVMTGPVDTDFDLIPDFQDFDSDGDGLSDADERAAGTGRTTADSDGDGVDDLVEVTAMTDPTDPMSNPRAEGDFYFLVPYTMPPVPPRDTLVFTTIIQRADVFFMIDTSISMQEYIDTIRASMRARIIPGVDAAITDVQFGAGQFDHCPENAYQPSGGAVCTGIQVDQVSTADIPAVDAALGSMTADCRPVAESYAQAAWVWATGDTTRWPMMRPAGCAPGMLGYGCVRPDALPILVMVGDERFDESYRTGGADCRAPFTCGTCAMFPTSMDIIDALASIRARMIVLGPTGTSPEWAPIVTASGAVDSTGAPLIFRSAGGATVDMAVVDGIAALAASTPLDISARARDVDDGDGVDATIFIDYIEANVAGGVADPTDMTRICVGGLPAIDSDGDGHLDTFTDVTPGTPVCFDIVAKMNDTVMPTREAQLFRAEIDVLGDGITVLDTREVFFLVPPSLGGGPG